MDQEQQDEEGEDALFVEVQAVVAGLPARLEMAPEETQTDMTCGRGPRSDEEDPITERLEEVLGGLRCDFPDHEELHDLCVLTASQEFLCLADHQRKRLYTAADTAEPKDWGANVAVMFGQLPVVTDRYAAARRQYPTYSSYASGHSRGGTIVLHLGLQVQDDPSLCFTRIDVFNAVVSPLARSFAGPDSTQLFLHRISGDMPSWSLKLLAAKELREREGILDYPDKHSLVHFFPRATGKVVRRHSDPSGKSSASVAGEEGGVNGSSGGSFGGGVLWSGLASLSCAGDRKARGRGLHSDASGAKAAAPTAKPQAQDPSVTPSGDTAEMQKAATEGAAASSPAAAEVPSVLAVEHVVEPVQWPGEENADLEELLARKRMERRVKALSWRQQGAKSDATAAASPTRSSGSVREVPERARAAVAAEQAATVASEAALAAASESKVLERAASSSAPAAASAGISVVPPTAADTAGREAPPVVDPVS